MLKITHLKEGDIITVDDDGIMREGTVVRVSREEHQALVDNGVQEFWYSQEDMYSLPLDEGKLLEFGFTREEQDGAVKYKKELPHGRHIRHLLRLVDSRHCLPRHAHRVVAVVPCDHFPRP